MPRFTPFPALRYSDRTLDDLIAPPYDVLSDADVDALNARSEFNITHVDVPRESTGDDRYVRAGDTLRDWVDAGVLEYDGTPTFTIYRMRFTDAAGTERDIAGVLGGLEVVDEGAGGVLPHERVTPKASTDRLDLTCHQGEHVTDLGALTRGRPDRSPRRTRRASLVGHRGRCRTRRRAGESILLASLPSPTGVAADDVLIADGHHRYGISRTYRDEIRSSRGPMAPPPRTPSPSSANSSRTS